MSGGIFLLRGDHELVEMRESQYEAEEVLQALIARFPTLLAGDQYPGNAPRRWLLVGREAALPDDEDAGGRWSVDHLFLDQDATPTLVEVKRSSDTRIRREVVGQMLDYAANGVVYWPLEQLREMFVRQCERDGYDPDLVISEVVGEDADVEDFWTHVGENLRAGNVRMVFVSDEIPRELRRVVEFLNGQMNPAEVIAIEVKQYLGVDGTKTLVPRVIGQTAEVEARKGRRTTRQRRPHIHRDGLLSSFDGSSEAKEAVLALLDWATGRPELEVSWRRAADIDVPSRGVTMLVRLWPSGTFASGDLEVQLNRLRLFNQSTWDAERCDRLIRRLEAGANLHFESDRRWPKAPIAPLADPRNRQAFLEIIEEVVRSLEPPA